MKKLFSVFVLTMTLMGCSSDGDSNPFGPSNPVNLNGHWIGTYNLASSTCPQEVTNFFPPSITGGTTVTQNGSQITTTEDSSGLQVSGTINTLTGEFTIGPLVFTDEGVTFSDVVNGRAISNNEITAEERVTISGPGLSCVITYQGTWRRG